MLALWIKLYDHPVLLVQSQQLGHYDHQHQLKLYKAVILPSEMFPLPALSIKAGIIEITEGGYPLE